MTRLTSYENLTIRISKITPFNNNAENLFMVKADELAGCFAHGATITEALDNFQKKAELWLKWFDNTPTKHTKPVNRTKQVLYRPFENRSASP
jgi:predicted RNase H-like HicB family nuclease